jgi:N-acetylglucosaminyl-diphospho-decaprenol L-rhamnosyltransferase
VDVQPGLAVVLVCHDSARELPRTLGALREQLEPGDELVVVDNASRDGTVDVARREAADARIVETGANLGFAGGAVAGARKSAAPLILFLNPDCIPATGALHHLRACAAQQPAWGAWQALVTFPDGERVNTAGNVVHFLGIGWAGRLGEPVSAVDRDPHEVGFASGAALVVRREAWNAVGGFDPRFFMYSEDLDLSLRLRLAGWGVGIAPAARVRHEYEFEKGGYKWFYLERNRWWVLLGVFPGRLLVLLGPALVAFELALMAVAWRGGWLREKLRAQRAVARELPAILRRRRAVQRTRAIGANAFGRWLSASLDSPYLADARRVPGAMAAQAAYYRVVLAAIGAGDG